MKKYSRLRAVIDLDAVMYNMEMMHANIEKETKMVVVIKTDGYGHGAVPISRMLEDVTMSGAMRSQLWMKVLYSEKPAFRSRFFAWDVFSRTSWKR